jgi:alkanesulfonate monooxygenase SsuD/methylene tetrahydromethanopterin reductase-like flavin-dependent oxidoreductase (luciferase family)
MDHGRPLEFGISVAPEGANLATIRELVRAADEHGIDLIGIQDHPYQRRFLDTMALIGHLLAETSRVRIFADVANLPLRHPAMLAKEAASFDVLSGGRYELGIGIGAFWDAIVAMGGPRRAPGEAVEALEEAITIIRAAWGGERAVRYRGRHYVVDGYRPGPIPVHEIEIWIGAYRPRMLRLTGRIGDGWIPSLGQIELAAIANGQRVIDEAASQAGRDPSAIRRMLNFGGSIGPLTDASGVRFGPSVGLRGSVDEWVERLSEWATDLALDTFILWPTVPAPGQVETFGRMITTQTRAEVARRRSAAGLGPPQDDDATGTSTSRRRIHG